MHLLVLQVCQASWTRSWAPLAVGSWNRCCLRFPRAARAISPEGRFRFSVCAVSGAPSRLSNLQSHLLARGRRQDWQPGLARGQSPRQEARPPGTVWRNRRRFRECEQCLRASLEGVPEAPSHRRDTSLARLLARHRRRSAPFPSRTWRRRNLRRVSCRQARRRRRPDGRGWPPHARPREVTTRRSHGEAQGKRLCLGEVSPWRHEHGCSELRGTSPSIAPRAYAGTFGAWRDHAQAPGRASKGLWPHRSKVGW